MTEQHTRPAQGSPTIPRQRSADGVAPPPDRAQSGAMGWVRFGGVMMAVIGAFAVVEGLAALLAPTYFVTVGGAVLAVSLTGWGWVHIVLGALVLATGLSLVGRAPGWARGVGVGLVAITMVVQLAWLPAYPIWSIVLLVLCAMVLYALVATWGDTADR
jgi:hypothetical protein